MQHNHRPASWATTTSRLRARIRAAAGRRRAGVAALGLIALLTSVTIIASIPSGDTPSIDHHGAMSLHPPPLATDRPDRGERPDRAVGDPLAHYAIKVLALTVRRGDTITALLRQHVRDWREITKVIAGNDEAIALYDLRPGEQIKLRIDHTGSFRELTYPISANVALRLTRSGKTVSVDRETRQLETRLAYASGTIATSFFDDAQTAGLSDALIMKLVEIFGWDIDFALQVRPGDTFAVVYEEKYWMGQKVSDGIIRAAEFVNRDVPFRAFALHDADGYTEYYSEQGMSMRRDFLRTPVELSRISSRYTTRRFHPILKTWRAHRGVDYAAPMGTPVRATAKGRVFSIGKDGGYGNVIVIRHGGTYSTLYAHLLRFQRGLRPGSYVDQGQIIGYVGKSGLATGPHLHYEFRVNNAHQDPLALRFPGSKPVPARLREPFFHNVHLLTADLEQIRFRRVATNR